MTQRSPGPIGRLAPSPTGHLHVGHARSFLAAWWSVRSRGGRIVLRIEDLDRDRCKPIYTEAIYRDLQWLGLDWDGEPLVQSEDLAPYHAAAERLLAANQAFPCLCSRRDLEQIQSAPHAHTGERRYPGTCRDRFDSLAAAQNAGDRPIGVRLRVPHGPRAIQDGLHGTFTADPSAECGDFVILRRDGQIAYQLAVCVDDARQGIDEVVRGADLLPSAARQELIHQALATPPPAWFHVPLVHGPGGRLAKRTGGATLTDLRTAGHDPRQLIAWCATTLGIDLSPTDRPTAAELTDRFAWPRVPLEEPTWSPPS